MKTNLARPCCRCRTPQESPLRFWFEGSWRVWASTIFSALPQPIRIALRVTKTAADQTASSSGSGGLLNQTSKVASTVRDSGVVRTSLGSWGRHRLELDANKVLRAETLAVALAAVHQENGSWRAFEFNDRKRLFGSVT